MPKCVRRSTLLRLKSLRQQTQKTRDKRNFCLADFIAEKSTGKRDYIGAFAVTTGIHLDKKVEVFEQHHDEYNSILLKALADRLAEAFAEHMHQRVRKEFWGYQPTESLNNAELIAEKYRGIRPAPGYPACPDHTEKPTLFDLLFAPEMGIILTENFAMLPASSVSGYYFSHPDSCYFGVGKIADDQLLDYAKRKRMDLNTMKRWLAPNLNE